MKTKLQSAAGAALISVAAVGTAFADGPKSVATDALAAIFATYDVAAVKALLTEGYIQHNPGVPTGRAPILGLVPALKDAGTSITIHRVISEGNLVVTHSSYGNAQAFGGEHMVAFDILRIEDGKVAEHWDNLAVTTPPNPSGHTQVDGATEITDIDKTAENKELVLNFVNTVLKGGDASNITDFISTETYIQHNSGIADGLDGLGAALASFAQKGIVMAYADVHMAIAEGNFVLTASEGSLAGTPSAFYDLFRVEGGKIVEHWDIIADIPTTSVNDNGKF